MRYKKIEIDIYRCVIYVCEGNFDKLKTYLTEEEVPDADKLEMTDAKACCYYNGEFFIVYCPTRFTPGLLCHELLHAVFGVTTRVDIQLSSESEEAYTYLLQYIVDICAETKFLKYKNK